MPDLIITPDVVERGARAMYTWARACLTEALRPAPTPGPLDGQEPLIGETTWS